MCATSLQAASLPACKALVELYLNFPPKMAEIGSKLDDSEIDDDDGEEKQEGSPTACLSKIVTARSVPPL